MYSLEYAPVLNGEVNINKNHIPLGFCDHLPYYIKNEILDFDSLIDRLNQFHIVKMNSLIFDSNVSIPSSSPKTYLSSTYLPSYIDIEGKLYHSQGEGLLFFYLALN